MGTQMIDSPVRNLSERDWYPGASGYSLQNTETLSARGLNYVAKPRSRARSTAGWLYAAVATLNELVGREPNWDSYGAQPTDVAVAQLAANFLAALAQAEVIRAPHIGGLNDGSVQLEWYRNLRSLRVTFGVDGEMSVFYRDAASNELWDAEL